MVASNKVIHNNHKIYFFTENKIFYHHQKNMMKLLGAKVMLKHFENIALLNFFIYQKNKTYNINFV